MRKGRLKRGIYNAHPAIECIKFGKVQLDSFNGRHESENTFKERTGINLNEIKDKLVLDVGCGAGRFTEIVSKYGVDVIGRLTRGIKEFLDEGGD